MTDPTAARPASTPEPPPSALDATTAQTPPPAQSVLLPADWPAQAADTVERVVGQVRDRTTVPAMTAARGVVYGLLAALLGVTALVLVCVGIVRVLDVLIPRGVWIAYAILGGILVVLGAVLWSRRHAHDPTA